MINLFTGTPGAGKTAKAVAEMLDLLAVGDRPIFVHAIPELKLPHELVLCQSNKCDFCPKVPEPENYLKADEWYLWAPDGAVIFFDEVQNIYRPRASTRDVPDSVAAFETHRHRGLDFFLVSQHPNLFDINVRNVVSRHVHLTASWARRIAYEWPECHTNVQATATAIKSTYSIPKRVYGLYKSATLHTKVKRKIPAQLYVLAFVVIMAVILGYRFYQSRLAPVISPSAQAQTEGRTAPPPTFGSASPASPEQLKQRFDFVPTVPNHPESAPAYAEIAKPKDFPRLVGCVQSKDRCTCYTQQATEYAVNALECADLVKRARFNPYKDPNGNDGQPRTFSPPVRQQQPPPVKTTFVPPPTVGTDIMD